MRIILAFVSHCFPQLAGRWTVIFWVRTKMVNSLPRTQYGRI